ncbi:MAG: DUF433 domain-containing protein [Gemmataceae bacterium]
MATAAPTALGVSKEHITKTPNVCGGRACIAGTRIRVMDVVAQKEWANLPPEEIADVYDGITVADVYAALAYYYDHPAEIEADFESHRRTAEFGRTQPSKLKEALANDPGLRERFGG